MYQTGWPPVEVWSVLFFFIHSWVHLLWRLNEYFENSKKQFLDIIVMDLSDGLNPLHDRLYHIRRISNIVKYIHSEKWVLFLTSYSKSPGGLFEFCHHLTRSGPNFAGMGTSIIKIRRPPDRLISIKGIPILARRHLEKASCSLIEVMQTFLSSINFTHHSLIGVDGYCVKR